MAIDAIAARLMGFDPMSIPFLRMAHERGLGIADPREIELTGDDVSQENFGFETRRSLVIWGDQMIRKGFLRPLERLLLHSPLMVWAPFASNVYHDAFWYPTIGQSRIRSFMRTEWGSPFQKVPESMDQNQERRRGHFHRGRRGPDRRGIERRTQPQQVQGGRDQVDVEQIMRDIRARIAQRQGIDLSNQQIQDLAARRLESILDPRAIKPSLLEGLRRSAGAVTAGGRTKTIERARLYLRPHTIYDSPRAVLRFIRRLLNPLLKLFFNPNPLIRALHLQARLNVEAAEREAERDRRQTEWNALHYEILQRVVTDVSRVSLELQALTMRIESLNARIDFNDRRVRSIEGAAQSTCGRTCDGRRRAQPATESAATTQDSVEITSAERHTATTTPTSWPSRWPAARRSVWRLRHTFASGAGPGGGRTGERRAAGRICGRRRRAHTGAGGKPEQRIRHRPPTARSRRGSRATTP